MIEEAWRNSTDPAAMAQFLRERGKLSERKARLFAIACCRHIWPLLGERSRTAVEVAERFADGLASNRERHSARAAAAEVATEARQTAFSRASLEGMPAWRAAGAATFAASSAWQVLDAAEWASLAAGEDEREQRNRAGYAEQAYQAVLLRHMAKPFRLPKSAHTNWRTPAVVSLAKQAYQARISPAGILDPACIGRLHDAIVDAGCRETDLLDHLGGTEEHPPGCWGVDLVLDKT